MSMDNQRSTVTQPVVVGDAVPETATTDPTELVHTEPTKIDDQTQQGTVPTSFRSHTRSAYSRFYVYFRLRGGHDI